MSTVNTQKTDLYTRMFYMCTERNKLPTSSHDRLCSLSMLYSVMVHIFVYHEINFTVLCVLIREILYLVSYHKLVMCTMHNTYQRNVTFYTNILFKLHIFIC